MRAAIAEEEACCGRPARQAERGEDARPRPPRTGCILVVEDDPAVRMLTAHVLRKAGYEVLESEDGVRGLECALEHHPDLILSDVVMPEMDGMELCNRVKATPELAGTFFVMLSGERTASHEQSDGLDLGADGYIARPVSNRELLARVAAMLRIKRAEDERDRVIEELRAALAKLKAMWGIVPICMHCKKVRDDTGYWNQVEQFVARYSDATFTHGVCPTCLAKHYPDEE